MNFQHISRLLLCALSLIYHHHFSPTASQITTCEGNANDADCVFPFTNQAVTFNTCTYVGDSRLWCGTTSDYDTDGIYGYCDCNLATTPAPTISASISPTLALYPHWAYTKALLRTAPAQVLQATVVRLQFSGEADIPVTGWDETFLSVNRFYLDSSWDQLSYNFTVVDPYESAMDGSTITTGKMSMEAVRIAAEVYDLYWCNGVCGMRGNLARINDSYYDQHVIVMYQQSGNSAFNGWTGIGTTGVPRTWMKTTGVAPDIMEHELGHNLGLPHQYPTKYERMSDPSAMDIIDVTNDGVSRMGSGGTVYHSVPASRFQENGHFGPCAKDWFGWLDERTHIVTLTPPLEGDSESSTGIYVINAYDRPDIIPDDSATMTATNSNIFAVRLEWPSQYEYYSQEYYRNRIYIFYRTSYGGPDAGASVQYCMVKPLTSDAGGKLQTYTYDVRGDTQKMEHYIPNGASFVVSPFVWSLEDNENNKFVNPYQARRHIANVTVLSVGDWSSCDDSFICTDTPPNLSITVKIDMVAVDGDDTNNNNNVSNTSDSGTTTTFANDPYSILDDEIVCTTQPITHTYFVNASDIINGAQNDYFVIRVKADELGVYGRATTTINVCANYSDVQAFMYDTYPYGVLNRQHNAEHRFGYGAVQSFPFLGNSRYDFTDDSTYLAQAIQLVQNVPSSILHIGEVQIYDSNITATRVNIASQSTCYSFSSGESKEQPQLIDSDFDTFSWSAAGASVYDACVFREPVFFEEVDIWPRNALWLASTDFTLKIWARALLGSTQSGNDLLFGGLIHSVDIENSAVNNQDPWEDAHASIHIPQDQKFATAQCDLTQLETVEFIGGEFYLVLQLVYHEQQFNLNDADLENDVIKVQLTVDKCVVTQCPINTYESGVDGGDGSLQCTHCPSNHYAAVGSTALSDCEECPHHRALISEDQSWCDIQGCQKVLVTQDSGLSNPLIGIYYKLGHIYDDGGSPVIVYLSNTYDFMIWYNRNEDQFQILNVEDYAQSVRQQKQVYAYAARSSTEERYPFLIAGGLNGTWIMNTSLLATMGADADQQPPIQVRCPYIPARSCEAQLNELCDPGWIAREVGFRTTTNSDIEWLCINSSVLTDDLLNYNMHMDVHLASSGDSARKRSMSSSQRNTILSDCQSAYIIDSLSYQCTVTHALDATQSQFADVIGSADGSVDVQANDRIECAIQPYNSGSNLIVFHTIAWSIQLIAQENEFRYYARKGAVVINESATPEPTVSVSLTVPDCNGTWNISLSIDQTPIGGQLFELFELSAEVEVGVSNASCVGLYSRDIISLVDVLDNTYLTLLLSDGSNEIDIPDNIPETTDAGAGIPDTTEGDGMTNDTDAETSTTGTLPTPTKQKTKSKTKAKSSTIAGASEADFTIYISVASVAFLIIVVLMVGGAIFYRRRQSQTAGNDSNADKEVRRELSLDMPVVDATCDGTGTVAVGGEIQFVS